MKTKYLLFAGLSLFSLLTSCNATPEKGEQGIQGEQGEKGDKGDTGETGKDGTKIYTGDGIPNDNTGVEGDLYIDTSTWDIYVKGVSTWSKSGNIKGDAGNNGVDGESAYQTWLDNGHIGNENDFLDWLKGTNGTNGVSVTNVYINDDNGNLICELSNGQTVNAGKVKDTTTYTVSFYVNNSLLKTETVANGSKINAPTVEVIDGYEVSEWYTLENNHKISWSFIGSTVTSDISLYLDKTPIEYTITYKLDGGVNNDENPSTYTIVTENITLKDPHKGGYLFLGWYSDADFTTASSTINKGSTGNKTFYAKYIENSKAESLGMKPAFDFVNHKVTYGLYPQTHVNDEATITALNNLSSTQSNGWYLLNGTYYVKMNGNPFKYGNKTFDDGTTIESGTSYWFKCEPITWKIIATDNDTYTILTEKIVDNVLFGNSNIFNVSNLRTFLTTTFYNRAFYLNKDHNCILTTTVDNSAATTSSSTNPHACANTSDKIFPLSYKDYLKVEYGFSVTESASSTREAKGTDFMKANGGACYETTSYGFYWTRSPNGSNDYGISYIDEVGKISYHDNNQSQVGVRPAMRIKVS